MTAVVLACLSASLFGAMSVALRLAMRRSPDADVGAVVTVAVAFLVAVVAAAIDPGGSPFRHLGQLAFFAAIGLLAPGGAQLLLTHAIRDAG
ncbi:MAG: hypothetical protein QOE36_3551, partial [Gaiellaceae bacterium]|nr:hypothetical protein [Gaiellaceae bacterium]